MTQEEIQINNIKEHNFDKWAKNLMKTKFTFDKWQCKQVGINNEGPYKNEYNNITINDIKESLVNCSDYGLVNKDHYLNYLWSTTNNSNKKEINKINTNLFYPFAWLRKKIAIKLSKADKLLRKHDLFLVVSSGWRHPETQKISQKMVEGDYGSVYIKKAFSSAEIPPHSTGGAVDIELWSLQTNKPLSFSYSGDIINSFVLENKVILTKNKKIKKEIRRILYHVLCSPNICLSKDEIFTVHPGEFWHFGFGDPLSSYLNKKNESIYGFIEPNN